MAVACRASEFLREPRRRLVLRLHPEPLPRPIRISRPLRNDSLKATLAHHLEQRLAVLERRHHLDVRPFHVESLEIPEALFTEYEWVEEGKPYREALIPAARLNPHRPRYLPAPTSASSSVARSTTRLGFEPWMESEGTWPPSRLPPENWSLAERHRFHREQGWVAEAAGGVDLGEGLEVVNVIRNWVAHPGRLIREAHALPFDENVAYAVYATLHMLFEEASRLFDQIPEP